MIRNNPTTVGKIENSWQDTFDDVCHGVGPVDGSEDAALYWAYRTATTPQSSDMSGVVVFEKEINGDVAIVWLTHYHKIKEMCLSVYVGPKQGHIEYVKKFGTLEGSDDIFESSTGNVGISGLKAIWKAMPGVIDWCKSLRSVEKVTACPTDDRRQSAYKILEKIGFSWDSEEEEYRLTV